MFKLPSNIQYRVFDKTFKASTARYLVKEDKAKEGEVQNNRAAICKAMDAHDIAILHQVHGVDVYYAAEGTKIGSEPQMDAVYTDKKNIILAIQTADCVPVLIADKEGHLIGAAHCGWKSAVKGILEKLIAKMEGAGASKFVAIIGPSIHQESYEVNKGYFDLFLDEDIANARFFIPSQKLEHFMFDLSGYVRFRLELLGISDIYHIYEDTYKNSEKYPSYRRHCHNGEEYKSSILSTIVMR
jgi:YfiH family protein